MGVPFSPSAQRPTAAAAALGDDPAFRERVRARDPEALGRVFEVYWKPLYERARLILPPSLDPEDVAGDVMLRLVEEADTYDPSRPLYPWLAQVCVNQCLNRKRRYRPMSWWRKLLLSESLVPPATGIERREARNALSTALRALSEEQREAIILRHLFGLEDEEIANLVGVGARQVRRLLSDGLRKLRGGSHGGPHGDSLEQYLGTMEDSQ